MDVVDRYLLNVRTYLPRGRADEDVAELRENIRSQVEDREERLGRPLTEEERIAVLRAHGHPILVAGRYRSDGRRLVLGREVIGPGPAWRLLYLGLVASSAISLVTPAMTLVRPTLHRFGWLVSLFSSGAFIAFAAASFWTSGWVVPASSPSAAGTIAAAQRINTWVAVGLGISVVMTALATVVEVVRGAWRELRRTGPA